MMRTQLIRTSILASGLLLVCVVGAVGLAQAASHWPASISGPTGFQDIGKAITKDPGFPAKGSEVEKARFVFSKIPQIAKTYSLEAGSGGKVSDFVIGGYRTFVSDPENAESLKGCTGWGDCGEWSYAFQEILGGAGVTSKVVYADISGGTGHSGGFRGTDTTVIVEERTPDFALSRRVFDAFRAAHHGEGSRPTAGSVAEWGDRPLTVDDKLPRDAGQLTWQEQIGGKPFIKDATSQTPLPPHEPIDVQTQGLRDRRDADRKKAEEGAKAKAAEEAKRKAEEEAKRKLQAALKQAEELIAAARAAAGRAQSAMGAAKGAAAAGNAATSLASAAQGAVQQAKGAVDAARSACARVSEGIIDAGGAEAAAGEVGALYQEVVDLAKQACEAAVQVQKAANAGARRILNKKAGGLAARAQSRAGSALAAAQRARREATMAARVNADRQAAIQQAVAARAAIAAAQGQVSATEGAMNGYEASVTSAQGQMATAQTEIGQMEQNKKGALGVLSPFLSEPQAQMLVPVINGIVAPSSESVDQQLQAALTAIQQARATVASLPDLLATWGGSFASCEGLAPTDSLAQAAEAAASAAELFLPKISAAAARAAECAGQPGGGYDASNDPGMGGGTPDTEGATEAGAGFGGGGPAEGQTSGATGGEVREQPGLKPPPTGSGETAGTGQGTPQGIWCYSEKTKGYYMIPYGPCPSPHLKPPTGSTAGGEPGRTPWQGLVPPEGTPSMEPKPPMGGGPCKSPCHIKPGTKMCHCPGDP